MPVNEESGFLMPEVFGLSTALCGCEVPAGAPAQDKRSTGTTLPSSHPVFTASPGQGVLSLMAAPAVLPPPQSGLSKLQTSLWGDSGISSRGGLFLVALSAHHVRSRVTNSLGWVALLGTYHQLSDIFASNTGG